MKFPGELQGINQTGSFSRIKIGKINVMDTIWDRKSFEVGGHWSL